MGWWTVTTECPARGRPAGHSERYQLGPYATLARYEDAGWSLRSRCRQKARRWFAIRRALRADDRLMDSYKMRPATNAKPKAKPLKAN
jgi:hypothetical protein